MTDGEPTHPFASTAPRSRRPRIAVVGAGISGLTCAGGLAASGLEVTVFDKARGAGGRSSTRRGDGIAFDYGAQYFTARDPGFVRQVTAWERDGVVRPWLGEIVSLSRGEVTPGASETRRFVGVPGMSQLTRHLAAEVPTTTGFHVHRIARERARSALISREGARRSGFDAVVLATPGPQAAALAAPIAPGIAERARDIRFSPCWAVMLAFDERLPLTLDGAFVEDSPLSWVARNSSKPGRPDQECWVLHGSPAWSDAHIEDDAASVETALRSAFAEAAQINLPTPTFSGVHRWRFALPGDPLPDRYLFDPEAAIGLCGDWCSGPRVEGAFLSGAALAERLSIWFGEQPVPRQAAPS